MSNLYSLEYEKNLLSGLLQFPDCWGDVASRLVPADFSKVNGAVFSAIASYLNTSQTISATILGEKLKSLSIVFEDIEPYDYLKALELIPVKKEEVENLAKEIKKLSFLREHEQVCVDIRSELNTLKNKSFEEISSFIDRKMSSVGTTYYKAQEIDIFEGMESLIETRALNPVKPEEIGFAGPFPTWNRILGNCSVPGGLVLIGSRTGGKKSSLGFFYNVYLAEKYGLPILHLDAGEMTPDEIRFRAACCLSKGKIPLHEVESGQWANKKEYANIMRGDIWPRIKKIKMAYYNVGNMSLSDIVTLIRRHYFRKVGRGNHLLINLDYIKGAVPNGRNVQEFQELGFGMAAFKTLITDEILASAWTSVQNNRLGITANKPGGAINDSEEVFSLSDRLVQQATLALNMRAKVPDELTFERGEFGDLRLTPVKFRRLLGPDYEQQLQPVLMNDGSYVRNYYSLSSHSFYFEDKGDLRMMLDKMGMSQTDIASDLPSGTLL